MSDDYIPSNDEEFDAFQKKLLTAVAADPAKYGCTAQDVTTAQASQGVWSPAFATFTTNRDAFKTSVKSKDEGRKVHEPVVRAIARKVNATPGMDNATRISVGLPPHNGTHKVIDVPATRPLGRTEAKGHLTLAIHFTDEATPHKTAKPHGVHGCEIYTHVGDPAPAEPSGYTFLGLTTRTPYTDTHAATDAGKDVYYLLRWQNTKGENGAWSDVVTGKVPV
jgi:hypothetical protein